MTSGRRWSNHCRLTAAAGAKLGLTVDIVVNGPRVGRSPNLELIEQLGATIHQAETDDRAEREALVERVAGVARAAGHVVRVLPVGGSEVAGAWGQVLAALEVGEQAEALGLEPDVIVLPTATGGTQAGLVVGSAIRAAERRRPPLEVNGVVVARSEGELRAIVERLTTELLALAGIPAPLDRIHLEAGQLGDGYGHATEASDEAARLLARTEGILVDPIYTAKALAGLIAQVRRGELDGRRAIFWHGGGLPALFEPREP